MTAEARNHSTIPRRLVPFTRALWLLLMVIYLVIFAADQLRLTRQPITQCAAPHSGCTFMDITTGDVALLERSGLSAAPVRLAGQLLAAIARLSLPLVGAVIFWKRPDDWVAWCLSLAFQSVLAEGAAGLGRLQGVVQVAFAAGVLAWLPVPFVFPNGRLEPRWMRGPVAVFFVVGFVAWVPAVGAWLLKPELLSWLQAGVGVVWPVLAGYSLLYRYRHVATAVERQQTKWVIAGFMAMFFTSTLYVLAATLFPPWQPSPSRLGALALTAVTYPLGYAVFAASLGFALLRYRLWDVDVVVRRTLVYSTLTAVLALVYFGAVTIWQQVLHGLTGQTGSLAVIASTLLVAAMFQPVRQRVQTAIDRRFYRRKYDMALALAAFASAARDQTDLDTLAARLELVVQDTLQPAHCSLWLRPPPRTGQGAP